MRMNLGQTGTVGVNVDPLYPSGCSAGYTVGGSFETPGAFACQNPNGFTPAQVAAAGCTFPASPWALGGLALAAFGMMMPGAWKLLMIPGAAMAFLGFAFCHGYGPQQVNGQMTCGCPALIQ